MEIGHQNTNNGAIINEIELEKKAKDTQMENKDLKW